MEEAYIKCKYREGMFSNEYFITFNGSKGKGLGGTFNVYDNSLIKKDKENGLAAITVTGKDEKTSSILVHAGDMGGGEYCRVPNEDIVPRKKLIKYLMRNE